MALAEKGSILVCSLQGSFWRLDVELSNDFSFSFSKQSSPHQYIIVTTALGSFLFQSETGMLLWRTKTVCHNPRVDQLSHTNMKKKLNYFREIYVKHFAILLIKTHCELKNTNLWSIWSWNWYWVIIIHSHTTTHYHWTLWWIPEVHY